MIADAPLPLTGRPDYRPVTASALSPASLAGHPELLPPCARITRRTPPISFPLLGVTLDRATPNAGNRASVPSLLFPMQRG